MFGERIHVKRMNHGQWRVMEEWRKVDGMMRVNFVEEGVADL